MNSLTNTQGKINYPFLYTKTNSISLLPIPTVAHGYPEAQFPTQLQRILSVAEEVRK